MAASQSIELDIDAGDHVIALVNTTRDVDLLPPYLNGIHGPESPGVIVAGPSQQAEVQTALPQSGMDSKRFDPERFPANTLEADRLGLNPCYVRPDVVIEELGCA